VSELLVVVDMQNGFLREGNLASDRCLAVLPAVQAEVEAALAAGQRVLFTADTHEVDDAEFTVVPEHCIRGSREAELVDELCPYLTQEDVLLVRKRRYSGLFETEMEGSSAPLRRRLGADLRGVHRHLRHAHHCRSAQPGLAGDRGSSGHRHLRWPQSPRRGGPGILVAAPATDTRRQTRLRQRVTEDFAVTAVSASNKPASASVLMIRGHPTVAL
jgi:hypothetical protein